MNTATKFHAPVVATLYASTARGKNTDDDARRTKVENN